MRLNAQALKVVIEKGRAVGVAVAQARTEILRADREVIVSCGAIGSPRLFSSPASARRTR